ncbi:MAG: ATP-dependent helicase HrpB [Thalassotalea sp.]
MPTALPIDAIRGQFLASLKLTNTMLLSAPPGAGKSTRVPLWLLNLGLTGTIYLVQPRRLAAKSIAQYLAQALGEKVGQRVGYRLRDDTCVSHNTQLEVITEGVLIQIIQNDPEMLTTAMVVMDEFHERSLQTDTAFALLRDVQSGLNEELKLLLMSATLASDKLLAHLPNAKHLSCEGRSHPITFDYKPVKSINNWRQHTVNVIEQALKQFQDAILVFLPGSGDIHFVMRQLEPRLDEYTELCPLYGSLPLAAQQKAIQPSTHGKRKVVLATNIAETSLTIEGISLVIDSGLEKVACFDDNTLTNHLLLRTIAKDSAIQRAGRAGRLAKGHCIRLYSEEDFSRRPQESALAIQQADILPLLIEAARWGVKSLEQLDLLDFPNKRSVEKGWQLLIDLMLLDPQQRLTAHGEKVSQLSCHPRYAHMALMAVDLEHQHSCKGLTYLACMLAALLEQRDILPANYSRSCDITYRVQLLLKEKSNPRFKSLWSQINRLAKAVNAEKAAELPLNYCGALLAIAYPERVAKKRHQEGEFIAVYGKGITIDEQDTLAAQSFIVAAEVAKHSKGLQVRLAAGVDINQLLAWSLVAPSERRYTVYDEKKQTIVTSEQVHIGALVLKETQCSQPLAAADVQAIWLEQLDKQGIKWLKWSAKDLQLLSRWRWLNKVNPQLNLPDVSDQALLAQVSLWFTPFIDGILTKAKLNTLNLSQQLLSMLDYQQHQQFNELAPTSYISPTNRHCVIYYSVEKPPSVSLPMQELYGLTQGPTIGSTNQSSSVALVLELLSPAQRPIQITQDLAGFWQSSYKEVQKEMKAKYPKHFWPDDPANALPTNKTKKHMNKT